MRQNHKRLNLSACVFNLLCASVSTIEIPHSCCVDVFTLVKVLATVTPVTVNT